MLTEEVLVQKFITVVEENCPQLGELLHYCHVELINSYWGLPPRLIQHFVVYYPNLLSVSINAYKDIFRDFARSLGISNAVCMNATRIIRDPASTLKQRNPVLWLELLWVAVPTRNSNSHIDQDLLNSD